MTWVIVDAEGEDQEILEDESVLILARNQECAREWMWVEGLPPHARQFLAMPSPRRLEGYRPQTIIVLTCYSPDASLYHREIHEIVARSILKSSRNVRWIEGACP